MFHVIARTSRLALAAALVVVAAPWAEAETEDIAPARDNTIYEGQTYENNSCGAGSYLFAGVTAEGLARRALLRFDVAGSIPAGSTINRVTLTLEIDRSIDGQSAAMSLHALTTSWGEGGANCDAVAGGGQGAAANPGDATWLDARFQQQSWLAPGGDFGAARATASAGTFWFFSPNNWKMLVKVLDGCLINGRYWVFAAATTNVGYTLRVTDTRTGDVKEYTNPLGVAAPALTDTDAFATCP